MLTLRSLGAVPRAVANWAGISGHDERPVARILLYHGTPRRGAAPRERQRRGFKSRLHKVPQPSIG